MKLYKIIKIGISFILNLPAVWAQTINISNYTQSNTSIQIFDYYMAQTNNWPAILFVLGTFVILFTSMKLYKTSAAFSAASFITFLIALGFYGLGWFPFFGLMATLAFFVLGVVFLLRE